MNHCATVCASDWRERDSALRMLWTNDARYAPQRHGASQYRLRLSFVYGLRSRLRGNDTSITSGWEPELRPVRLAKIFENLLFERIEIRNGGLKKGTKLRFVARVTEEIVLVERRLGFQLIEDHIVQFRIHLCQHIRPGLLTQSPLPEHLGNESIHIGHGVTLRHTFEPAE